MLPKTLASRGYNNFDLLCVLDGEGKLQFLINKQTNNYMEVIRVFSSEMVLDESSYMEIFDEYE